MNYTLSKKELIIRTINEMPDESNWSVGFLSREIAVTTKGVSYILVPLVKEGYLTLDKRSKLYQKVTGKDVLDWLDKPIPRTRPRSTKPKQETPKEPEKAICSCVQEKLGDFRKDLQKLLDYVKELEEQNQKLKSESQDLYRQFCDLHQKLHRTPMKLKLDDEDCE